MTLTGEARRAYMQAYMRRKRAEKRTPKAGANATQFEEKIKELAEAYELLAVLEKRNDKLERELKKATGKGSLERAIDAAFKNEEQPRIPAAVVRKVKAILHPDSSTNQEVRGILEAKFKQVMNVIDGSTPEAADWRERVRRDPGFQEEERKHQARSAGARRGWDTRRFERDLHARTVAALRRQKA